MLINATQSEELRVAIVDVNSHNLIDLILERQSYKTKIGNIYLGKISSVEPSLDAAFVNFGSERHGFLPHKEIAHEYFHPSSLEKTDRPNIKEAIREGQSIMIQVDKEERGTKGAALTSFISLAGSYLVLMPNNPGAGGISRRVEGEDRDELREILSQLHLPEGMGIIVRTAGVGKSLAELQWDLESLIKQWDAIKKASEERDPPFLIHQESDIIIRTLRDYLRQDVTEIIVDNPQIFEKIKMHLEQIRPDFIKSVKLYNGEIPLFNRYQIEHQIESAYQREVRLPSGGSIVIDHTEALVAIDVNSARSTKGSDIEETALRTNLEAAEKIACQLRLRDLGGLVVIDFIDMSSVRHRREVENHLRNSLKLDKARTQIGSISQRFGLLEMSRQRLRPSLGEATQVVCPRCEGWGTIRGVESLALSIIRMIEEDAVKQGTAKVIVQLPVNIATFIINEKRELISAIEKNRKIEILVIPNPQFDSPKYHIKRVSEAEASAKVKTKASYELIEAQEPELPHKKAAGVIKEDEKPAVSAMMPSERPPSYKKQGNGLIKRFLTGLFGATEEEGAMEKPISEAGSEKPVAQKQPVHTQTKQARDEKRTITPTSSTRNQPRHEHRKAAQPQKTEAQEQTQQQQQQPADQKQRTRRGNRGGRRRKPQSTQQKPIPKPVILEDKPIEEPPNDLLPPFPTDLEDYYQETARVKVRKPTPSAAEKTEPPVETKTTVAAPIAPEITTPPPAATPEPLVLVQPKPAEEGAKPVVVRPKVIKEENTSDEKELKSETQENKEES